MTLKKIVTSKITDHHNKYNKKKVCNTVRTAKTRHRDVKWADAARKMVPTDLQDEGWPQTSNLPKNTISAKRNKTRYAWYQEETV